MKDEKNPIRRVNFELCYLQTEMFGEKWRDVTETGLSIFSRKPKKGNPLR